MAGKRKRDASELRGVDLVIATKPDMHLVRRAAKLGIPVIFYAIFPDQILGWDFSNNSFCMSIPPAFIRDLDVCRLTLVNSAYTRHLLVNALPTNSSRNWEVCHLGIDIKSIQLMRPPMLKRAYSKRVVWNHMWRVDKGFVEALTIIYDLALNHRTTDFYIGRKKDWSGERRNDMRAAYVEFVNKLRKAHLTNIHLISYFDTQHEYWAFLRSMDIGMSCAPHETFGLSMLEQAAAKLACVVPDGAVYPEVLPGAMRVPVGQMVDAVGNLLENDACLEDLANACAANAARFDIDTFVANLMSLLTRAV